MQAFSKAAFLGAAGRAEDLPAAGPPELAFAGRSNVGKSSAINALAGRRRLAYTSKTPGRTQTINLYALGEGARLADLPGYGYARVSKKMRAQWEQLVGAYLQSERPIAGVVVVMDARHPLGPLDERLLDWLGARRVLVLLAKCDKLTRREQAATLQGVCGRIEARGSRAEVHLFSSLTGQGVDETRAVLETWLAQAQIKSPR